MYVRRNPFDEPTPSAPFNLVAMWQETARLREAHRGRRRSEAAFLLGLFTLAVFFILAAGPKTPVARVQIGEPTIVNMSACPQSEGDP